MIVPDVRVAQGLVRFVEQVSISYSNVAGAMSVHTLVHLRKSALSLGPSWAASVFPFESANGILLELILCGTVGHISPTSQGNFKTAFTTLHDCTWC